MGKVQTQSVNKNERFQMIGEFYDIVTNLKTKKKVIGFFMGLLTPSEALMLSRRIQVAALLLDGESYEEIRRKLKVGVSTIASVNRWLFGENEEFKDEINKHKKRKDNQNIKGNKGKRYYDSLLDRYPGHRILRDLLGI